MVTIFSMGGFGKTTLATKLATSVQDQFEYMIWRSLQYTPPGNSLIFIQSARNYTRHRFADPLSAYLPMSISFR
ncbi:MAG: hypothetical protein V7K53_16730 [Nostoc sp.]|uniref:hypothetical protein n=1 Tax=Nostoc sp. TaxID=1180 RepID=UPI002FFB3DC4